MYITKVCTGCGACAVSCPKQCITMQENNIGEICPSINNVDCIKCNICKNTCPQNYLPQLNLPRACYVTWSKKDEHLRYCASGGMASVFLEYQYNNHEIGYGCDYNSSNELIHFAITNKEELCRARSSKYSQSLSFIVFKEINEYLKNKRKILFIGTPCQVAALKAYLKYDYENLITVDLVCHGTPPNKYIKEHLKYLKIDNIATKIRFRGLFDQYFTVWNGDAIIYKNFWKNDNYFKAFYENMISRKSCLTCKYARPERVSDITIGDFWGLGELKHIKWYSKRPSLVLINTAKGKLFFNQVKDYIYLEEREISEGIKGNGRLNKAPGKLLSNFLFRFLYRFCSFDNSIKFSFNINNIYKQINVFIYNIQKQKTKILKRINKQIHRLYLKINL